MAREPRPPRFRLSPSRRDGAAEKPAPDARSASSRPPASPASSPDGPASTRGSSSAASAPRAASASRAASAPRAASDSAAARRPAAPASPSGAAASTGAAPRRPDRGGDATARAAASEPAAKPTRAARAPRPPRPEPDREAARVAERERDAKAEVRAAARARRREEKREIRRFTRRARHRRIVLISASSVVLAMIAIVVAAVFSPLLALKTITVDGTSRLDAAQLRDAVDGQMDTPLALLDTARIEKQLSGFSLIRSYSTTIVPPHTLQIHIVERVPVGVLQTADGFELVDPAGVTVEKSDARPQGVPLIQLAASDDAKSSAFRSMADVLLAMPEAQRAQVDSITARTRDDVTLTLIGGTQKVVWGGSDDSARKAQVLQALLGVNGGAPGIYDVSAPGSAVFRAG
ncbi:FtsQ-type POTRA domain-containing protein [Schumannella luteola]|nr:FtsQ-type POTRA domain-containing protein [Schumannella luteola]